jgi:hypothetical protein
LNGLHHVSNAPTYPIYTPPCPNGRLNATPIALHTLSKRTLQYSSSPGKRLRWLLNCSTSRANSSRSGPSAWLRWAWTACSWLRQASALLLQTSVATNDIARQAFAAGTERPDRLPRWAWTSCSWLRPAWSWSAWLRWAQAPTSIRPDNRKRPKGKLLTLMRRLTACISRRRENEIAERERALAGFHAENRPESGESAAPCQHGKPCLPTK